MLIESNALLFRHWFPNLGINHLWRKVFHWNTSMLMSGNSLPVFMFCKICLGLQGIHAWNYQNEAQKKMQNTCYLKVTWANATLFFFGALAASDILDSKSTTIDQPFRCHVFHHFPFAFSTLALPELCESHVDSCCFLNAWKPLENHLFQTRDSLAGRSPFKQET